MTQTKQDGWQSNMTVIKQHTWQTSMTGAKQHDTVKVRVALKRQSSMTLTEPIESIKYYQVL